jgi:hypothetical protein
VSVSWSTTKTWVWQSTPFTLPFIICKCTEMGAFCVHPSASFQGSTSSLSPWNLWAWHVALFLSGRKDDCKQDIFPPFQRGVYCMLDGCKESCASVTGCFQQHCCRIISISGVFGLEILSKSAQHKNKVLLFDTNLAE